MTREDFAGWREHPVTKWVMAAHREHAANQKAAWLEASWNGAVDPSARLELHTRADAFEAICEATYDRYCQILGVEPEPEE